MSDVWVVLRDNGGAGSEVLAVFTADALALSVVDDLNDAARRVGARETFRALKVTRNSTDRLPGQFVEVTDEPLPGVYTQDWRLAGFLPLDALARHRPDWLPWPTVYGVQP